MIAYFSATGNSLFVASRLAEDLNEKLLFIPDHLKANQDNFRLAPDEVLGLVLPVYFYTVPHIVRQWLEKIRLDSSQNTYVFAILTCGGQTGQAGRILTSLLEKSGIRLHYTASVILPDNYIPLLTVPRVKQRQLLQARAEKELASIANQLAFRQTGDHDRNKSLFAPFLSTFAPLLYKNGRPTRPFFADASCTTCGLCVAICPEEVISLTGPVPVWQKKSCTHCLVCLHRCPARAIQYGKRTIGKERYTNPHVQFPV